MRRVPLPRAGVVPRLRSAGVIRSATRSRVATDRPRSAPDNREAARFNHIWASTLSCGTPLPLVYMTSEVELGVGLTLRGG